MTSPARHEFSEPANQLGPSGDREPAIADLAQALDRDIAVPEFDHSKTAVMALYDDEATIIEAAPPLPRPAAPAHFVAAFPSGSIVTMGPRDTAAALVITDRGYELWFVDASGTRKADLPPNFDYDRLLAFSPDGAELLIGSNFVVRVVDVATSAERQLLLGSGYCSVAWFGDGRAAVLSRERDHPLDPAVADAMQLMTAHGVTPNAGDRVRSHDHLYLVDPRPDAASILIAMLPCRADRLAVVGGGELLLAISDFDPSKTWTFRLVEDTLVPLGESTAYPMR